MKRLIILLLFQIVILCNALFYGEQCKDPLNEIGRCINVRECKSIVDKLMRRTDQDIRFIRKAHCGYIGRSPLVCCAERSGRQVQETTPYPRGPMPLQLENDCGRESVQLIVGGNATGIGGHPWQVGLQYLRARSKPILCGGVLISKNYVLTAAHCIRNDYTLNAIVLGEYDLDTNPDCAQVNGHRVCADPIQTIAIDRTIKYPGYDEKPGAKNDIALIRLKTPARFSDFVKPACLPSQGSRKYDKLIHTVVGWGNTEDGIGSRIKLKATKPIVDTAQCNNLFKANSITIDDKIQLCAGGKKGVDSCGGDSGGPLLVPDGPIWHVAGIVSFGTTECGLGFPGVYTRVSSYIDWIKQNIY